MKPSHWIIATVMAALTMISYVHGFVYTRPEGERVEKRMDLLELELRDEVRELRKDIKELDNWLRQREK